MIATQRWTGFLHGRHALAISVNDVISAQQAGTPHTMQDRYREVAAALLQHVVTEPQARRHLEELGYPAERRCRGAGCDARLPLGWLYCTTCGLPRGGHQVHASPADAFRVATVQPLPVPQP